MEREDNLTHKSEATLTDELSEGRPRSGFVVPAGTHNSIKDSVRTGIWLSKAPTVGYIDSLKDLTTRETRPRNEAVGEHLPERHPVGPDVAGAGKTQLVDGFQCAPRDRKTQIRVEVGLIVGLAQLQGSTQPEVANLHLQRGEAQNE